MFMAALLVLLNEKNILIMVRFEGLLGEHNAKKLVEDSCKKKDAELQTYGL